ncbi:MAG: rRNA pseudouridine synthase [Actinomycetota bacterium]|jgi:23S rRNA pseudouridine2605 synthase|nr:rRNA pseudouridine synthase [Actinomycetota bacterium]
MSVGPETPTGERIQKVLARAGVASRRAVEEMIVRGRIRVNGERVALGRRIDASKDIVEVDGSRVPLSTDLAYYLVNKPVGVVTTAHDEEGRETVMDLLEVEVRVFPVGRLDMDSEGAVLLTNDGELAQRLTHPSFGVPKTYLVEASGSVKEKSLRALARGVELDDGVTAPAEVRLVEKNPNGTLVEMSITEGRNRQIRRMFDAVGHPVRRLVRTAIGPLMLGRLKPATYRKLRPDEVMSLYRAAGL